MDLSQLEAFVAVVDNGSFTAAARALHLTQPALSRRIAGLESTTRLHLFDRNDRVVALTPEGRTLLRHARGTLAQTRALSDAVDSLHGLESGTLRITGLPSLLATELPDLVATYGESCPNVAIEIFAAADTDEVRTALAESRADVALSDLDVDYPGLQVRRLGSQSFVAVFPPDSLQEPPGDRVELKTMHLRGRTVVSLPEGTLTRSLTDSVLTRLGVTPGRWVTTTQRDALIPLALRGVGVTFAPERLALSAVAQGACLAWPSPAVVRHHGLIHRRGLASVALQAFLSVVTRTPESPAHLSSGDRR